ncbi:MAG: hypothetical protein M0Z41_14735 [Peptococcaceae bacterium]|nr:hypothetical protein [Peptococcaceae bacterium]
MADCRLHGKPVLGSGWFNPATTVLDGLGQGVPYAAYSFATQVAWVEVDTETARSTYCGSLPFTMQAGR